MADQRFPIIRDIQEAKTDADRAEILLRLSDAMLLKYSEVFIASCNRAGFVDGVAFVTARYAALVAVRDAHGQVPERNTALVEDIRQALSHFVAGKIG